MHIKLIPPNLGYLEIIALLVSAITTSIPWTQTSCPMDALNYDSHSSIVFWWSKDYTATRRWLWLVGGRYLGLPSPHSMLITSPFFWYVIAIDWRLLILPPGGNVRNHGTNESSGWMEDEAMPGSQMGVIREVNNTGTLMHFSLIWEGVAWNQCDMWEWERNSLLIIVKANLLHEREST